MTGAQRMALAGAHEQAIGRELRERGYDVEPFGQALLSAQVRKRLRDQRCPAHLSLMRWLPDLAVMLSGTPHLVAIDAKTNEKCNSTSRNHAIELRSILGGLVTRMPVVYVCCDMSLLTVKDLYERLRADATDPGVWPCCGDCIAIFRKSLNELQIADELPEYCPAHLARKAKGRAGGSGTPYVRFPRAWCEPLDGTFPRRRDGAA